MSDIRGPQHESFTLLVTMVIETDITHESSTSLATAYHTSCTKFPQIVPVLILIPGFTIRLDTFGFSCAPAEILREQLAMNFYDRSCRGIFAISLVVQLLTVQRTHLEASKSWQMHHNGRNSDMLYTAWLVT